MDEDSKMLSDPRPVYQVGCLPPEVLQIVLSHVVTRNDYRAWIRIASVCRSFARCLELYLPFDTVEVGYGPQSTIMHVLARHMGPSFRSHCIVSSWKKEALHGQMLWGINSWFASA